MDINVFKSEIENAGNDQNKIDQSCLTYLKDRCYFMQDSKGFPASKLLDVVAEALGVEIEC